MNAVKDYRSTFVKKGCERKVVEAYSYFGYRLESLQYVESDSEPWERYIYAFDTNEVYDALGAYPAPAKKKPYPFPGYVTLVFSLDKNDPNFAYYKNVYRLYRRVQFDIFTVSQRAQEQKKKMIMPLTFWIIYILLGLGSAALVLAAHFYNRNMINSGHTGILFSWSRVPQYFATFNEFLTSKAYVIGLITAAVAGGLIVFHFLWDLIYHGSKAAINNSAKRKLEDIRHIILRDVRQKKYPNIDSSELRRIENARGIYNQTSYNSETRRRDDAVYKHQKDKQEKRRLRREARAARRKAR